MSKSYWFEVPCAHGKDLNTSHRPTLPSYSPLSKQEVAKILDFMLVNKHKAQAWASAAVRLSFAIRGITCPYPAEGQAAQNHSKLDQLLADTVDVGGTPEKVEKVMNLLK